MTTTETKSGELARQALEEGWQAVALKVGAELEKVTAEREALNKRAEVAENALKNVLDIEIVAQLNAVSAERDALKAELADLRDFAYNRAPKLAAEEANKQNAKLRAALEQVEYVADATEGMEGFEVCPWCDSEPHADDCARQLALKGTE